MAQQRQIDTTVQRADHYETKAGRELCQRAVARVRALQGRNVAPDGGMVANSGGDSSPEQVYTRAERLVEHA